MGENSHIALSQNEKAVIGRYLNDIRATRALLAVKTQALDDILGVIIEAKGLLPSEYQVDLDTGVIVKRPDAKVE